jgi:hypothetical protein
MTMPAKSLEAEGQENKIPQGLPAPDALRGWQDGTVVRLAQTIYQERAWDRMPILGDALEEAGSASAEVLAHCRSGGLHVRGCWLVDWLLDLT